MEFRITEKGLYFDTENNDIYEYMKNLRIKYKHDEENGGKYVPNAVDIFKLLLALSQQYYITIR